MMYFNTKARPSNPRNRAINVIISLTRMTMILKNSFLEEICFAQVNFVFDCP